MPEKKRSFSGMCKHVWFAMPKARVSAWCGAYVWWCDWRLQQQMFRICRWYQSFTCFWQQHINLNWFSRAELVLAPSLILRTVSMMHMLSYSSTLFGLNDLLYLCHLTDCRWHAHNHHCQTYKSPHANQLKSTWQLVSNVKESTGNLRACTKNFTSFVNYLSC